MFAFEFLVTGIYIIHLFKSLKRINEVQNDLILIRFKWLEKRHLGARRIIGLLFQLLMWIGIIAYVHQYINKQHYDLISLCFSNNTNSFAFDWYSKWFKDNFESVERV